MFYKPPTQRITHTACNSDYVAFYKPPVWRITKGLHAFYTSHI